MLSNISESFLLRDFEIKDGVENLLELFISIILHFQLRSIRSSRVSLLMHLVIGAYEKRKFISFDVPGAFLQAKFDDDKMLLLKLRRDVIVDTMCEVNPEHKKNIRYENGKKVLYKRVI